MNNTPPDLQLDLYMYSGLRPMNLSGVPRHCTLYYPRLLLLLVLLLRALILLLAPLLRLVRWWCAGGASTVRVTFASAEPVRARTISGLPSLNSEPRPGTAVPASASLTARAFKMLA